MILLGSYLITFLMQGLHRVPGGLRGERSVEHDLRAAGRVRLEEDYCPGFIYTGYDTLDHTV